MANILRVTLPPAALFGIVLALGIGLESLVSRPLLPESFTVRLVVGVGTCLVGAGIGAWALDAFRRAHTSPDFGRPVTELVEQGPFRFSRNPLYVALNTVLLGFSFLLNTLWLLLGVLLLLILLDRTVVVREEQHLRAQFGERYISYAHRVRRWL